MIVDQTNSIEVSEMAMAPAKIFLPLKYIFNVLIQKQKSFDMSICPFLGASVNETSNEKKINDCFHDSL